MIRRASGRVRVHNQPIGQDIENHAHIVTVTTGERIGPQVVVLQGLHPGDRVVADGVQKIVEGAAVNPIPYSAEAGK